MKLEDIVNGITPLDQEWIGKAQARTEQLVMPTRALGRLHEISERMCAIQKTLKPSTRRKAVLVMAADHGIVDEGVSAYPQEVTGAMVQTFLVGGAGISAISRHVDAEVFVVDTFEQFDYIRVITVTGRTHQIRVHLSHVSHPILGDPVYGGRRVKGISSGGKTRAKIGALLKVMQRQALHASRISFAHPVSGEWLDFRVALPEDMRLALEMMYCEQKFQKI